MEYDKMSNDELKSLMVSLEDNFKQYQEILKEAYVNMEEVSSEYEKIRNILEQRNV